MKAAKIKFAVVGYGHIGRKHAAMIQGNEHAELVAVVDTDPDKLSEFKTGKIKGFTSYDEFLATDLDVNVINICTPNGLHSAQAIQALERKSHVVIEKPMGLSRNKCEEVIFKSLQVSRHVFCVKQNRYSPTSVWLKSICE